MQAILAGTGISTGMLQSVAGMAPQVPYSDVADALPPCHAACAVWWGQL